jgi:ATP phosphoribosyltransferase regulatory subunit HisZ
LTDTTNLREELKRRIDAIESGYELMLAYAAQGLPTDQGSPSGGQLRDALSKFDAALTGLAALLREIVAAEQADRQNAYTDFLDVLERDARAAQAGLHVVIGQPGISSMLVDNLNASIHVRALLTDVFLVDEALK